MSISFYLKIIYMIINKTAISGTQTTLKDNILNLLQMLRYTSFISDYSECSIWFEPSTLKLCSDIVSHLTENGIKITAKPLAEASTPEEFLSKKSAMNKSLSEKSPMDKSFTKQFPAAFPKALIILFPDQAPESINFETGFQKLADKIEPLPTSTLLFAASTNRDLPIIKALHSWSTLFQNGKLIQPVP